MFSRDLGTNRWQHLIAKTPLIIVLAGSLSVCGCRSTDSQQILDPEYHALIHSVQRTSSSVIIAAAEAVSPVSIDLEGAHGLEDYIVHAIRQNPEVQAARKQMESLAYLVPVAASLQDPNLAVTVQPKPVQTASGEQTLAMAINQKFPWFGKLEMRAGVAEEQTNIARAKLAAAELNTIEKVKRAYFELYFIQQSTKITEAEQQLLGDIRDVANTRYKTGQTSQQDVLRADLEISNVETDLIQLRQKLQSGQAALARLLHISPQTKVLALDEIPRNQMKLNLESLQEQAIAARPELHAQLAAIQRDRQTVQLARLNYKPDVTLGLNWINVSDSGISPVANGDDAFMMSAGINMPIYRKRLDSQIRSAEAKVVATARQYDALKDNTLEEVTDLFAKIESQKELLLLFEEDILPKARLTLEVSSRAYNVGEVDFLQLIDNWRELLRYEIRYRRQEASLQQSLAQLERVVGGVLVTSYTMQLNHENLLPTLAEPTPVNIPMVPPVPEKKISLKPAPKAELPSIEPPKPKE
ncbi:MAG: TolC family protein [Planctomycetaceae bacterium]|nr:TolC family protein [Planctomycetaceae bacterium]